MVMTSYWWETPEKFDLFINEYQIYSVLDANNVPVPKRRLLCRTNYHFFQDPSQDLLQKCLLLIRDDVGDVCFKKMYWQVDNVNRHFYTDQYVFICSDMSMHTYIYFIVFPTQSPNMSMMT